MEVLISVLIVLVAVIRSCHYDGLQPMLFDLRLVSKKMLVDISEPAM